MQSHANTELAANNPFPKALTDAIIESDLQKLRDILIADPSLLNKEVVYSRATANKVYTPIILAISKLRVEVVDFLLHTAPQLVGQPINLELSDATRANHPNTLSPLMTAASGGCQCCRTADSDYNSSRIVDMLLTANTHPNVNYQTADKSSALMCAVTENNQHLISKLINHPAINMELKDNRGCTALHLAVKSNHLEAVILLLNAPTPADPNNRCDDGFTPLMDAAGLGFTDIFSELMENAACIQGLKNACAAKHLFHCTTFKKCLDINRILLNSEHLHIDLELLDSLIAETTDSDTKKLFIDKQRELYIVELLNRLTQLPNLTNVQKYFNIIAKVLASIGISVNSSGDALITKTKKNKFFNEYRNRHTVITLKPDFYVSYFCPILEAMLTLSGKTLELADVLKSAEKEFVDNFYECSSEKKASESKMTIAPKPLNSLSVDVVKQLESIPDKFYALTSRLPSLLEKLNQSTEQFNDELNDSEVTLTFICDRADPKKKFVKQLEVTPNTRNEFTARVNEFSELANQFNQTSDDFNKRYSALQVKILDKLANNDSQGAAKLLYPLQQTLAIVQQNLDKLTKAMDAQDVLLSALTARLADQKTTASHLKGGLHTSQKTTEIKLYLQNKLQKFKQDQEKRKKDLEQATASNAARKAEWELKVAAFIKTPKPAAPTQQPTTSTSSVSSSNIGNHYRYFASSAQPKTLADLTGINEDLQVREALIKIVNHLAIEGIKTDEELLMERNALLGICAKAMEAIKSTGKEKAPVFPTQIANHFRNVIFHSHDIIPAQLSGEAAVQFNEQVRDMALKMIAYVNNKPRDNASIDTLSIEIESELFVQIIQKQIAPQAQEYCLQQLLTGNAELTMYKNLNGASQVDLEVNAVYDMIKQTAIGFSKARLGTYASETLRRFKENLSEDEIQLAESCKQHIAEGNAYRHNHLPEAKPKQASLSFR